MACGDEYELMREVTKKGRTYLDLLNLCDDALAVRLSLDLGVPDEILGHVLGRTECRGEATIQANHLLGCILTIKSHKTRCQGLASKGALVPETSRSERTCKRSGSGVA